MKKLFVLLLFAFIGAGASAQTLADAQNAIEVEKYEQAKVILEKLVAANPDDGQYEFHLGNIYLTLGEDALAKACFERGVTAKKNGQLNYIGLGRIMLDDGNSAGAAAEFDKAMYKMKKKDTDKYLYIAKSYYDSFNPDYAKSAQFARKAVEITPDKAAAWLVLGDAEYKLDNLNEAYKAYRNAYTYDNNLLRGKLNLAVITKDSHAFPEAVNTLNEIIELNPSYGPSYRELAEVYYMWAQLDPSVHEEYIAKALEYYEMYMQRTENSLDARMRHADFLVLAKDYEALEKEAAEMQKIGGVNPRILRYLGYSANENGNYSEAAQALTDFLNVIDPRRALGIDYAYLAKAEVKLLEKNGLEPMNTTEFDKMLADLGKAVEKDAPLDNDFSDLGIALYKVRQYDNAAAVFGELINASEPRLMDRLYFANSIFYNAANMDEAAQAAYVPTMKKADEVYEQIITASPTTQDPYYNRARLNRYIPGAEAKTAELFQQFIDVTMAKGESETSKPLTKTKLADSYTSIGAYLSDIDKDKAVAMFEKALEYEPANEHALASLKFLKK